jgi:hypothetical protein
LQWIILGLNLFIHSFMYMHYALSALKVSAPWKQYLTRMQIMQFVIGMVRHTRARCLALALSFSLFCSLEHPNNTKLNQTTNTTRTHTHALQQQQQQQHQSSSLVDSALPERRLGAQALHCLARQGV